MNSGAEFSVKNQGFSEAVKRNYGHKNPFSINGKIFSLISAEKCVIFQVFLMISVKMCVFLSKFKHFFKLRLINGLENSFHNDFKMGKQSPQNLH